MSAARIFAAMVIAASLLAAGGCHLLPGHAKGHPAASVTNAPPVVVTARGVAGKVIRVNAGLRYVVVECVVLPRDGEEATVCRGEQAVGRVRFTAPFAPPFATADLIEGFVMAGDRVRN